MVSFSQPDRLIADGVELTRDPTDAGRWHYLSLGPWPQTTEDGTPLVSIIKAGDFALVQISCQLDPPGPVLEQYRTVLEREGHGPVTLHNAVTRVDAIRVLVAAEIGQPVELDHSAGSGFPPYTTIFQLQLEGPDLAAVEAALTGQPDRLHVSYELQTLSGEAVATADVSHWFGTEHGTLLQQEPTHQPDHKHQPPRDDRPPDQTHDHSPPLLRETVQEDRQC